MKLISKPILKKLTKQIELCRKCKGKKNQHIQYKKYDTNRWNWKSKSKIKKMVLFNEPALRVRWDNA